jgi:hypothetical protein
VCAVTLCTACDAEHDAAHPTVHYKAGSSFGGGGH